MNRTTSPAIRRSPRKPKAKKRRDYNKDIDEDTEAINDEDEDIIEDRQSDSSWRPGNESQSSYFSIRQISTRKTILDYRIVQK